MLCSLVFAFQYDKAYKNFSEQKNPKRKDSKMFERVNKNTNKTNQKRLDEIRSKLFTIANSYSGDEYGHIACRLHQICNELQDTEKRMRTASLN